MGEGGVTNWDNQYETWPEIFYLLREEFWKKGYATEFVKKFLGVWWSLPRENTRIRVRAISLGKNFDHQEAKEQLGAQIQMSNKGSIRVIEKAGFEFCGYLHGEEEHGYWRFISPN